MGTSEVVRTRVVSLDGPQVRRCEWVLFLGSDTEDRVLDSMAPKYCKTLTSTVTRRGTTIQDSSVTKGCADPRMTVA